MKDTLSKIGFIFINCVLYILLNFLYIKTPEEGRFYVAAVGSSIITIIGWILLDVLE